MLAPSARRRVFVFGVVLLAVLMALAIAVSYWRQTEWWHRPVAEMDRLIQRKLATAHHVQLSLHDDVSGSVVRVVDLEDRESLRALEQAFHVVSPAESMDMFSPTFVEVEIVGADTTRFTLFSKWIGVGSDLHVGPLRFENTYGLQVDPAFVKEVEKHIGPFALSSE